MVKVSINCGYCLINRAIAEIEKTETDQTRKFELLRKIFDYFSKNFDEMSVPSNIGTIRDRIIRNSTNKDPYKQEKIESNKIALNMVPEIESLLNSLKDDWARFKKSILTAIAGNIMEFDIIENQNPIANLRDALENIEKDLVIDDSELFYTRLKNANSIVYLTDNAGEIVFDKIFIQELVKYGKKIVVIVKEKPVLNDATMEDAVSIGLTTISENVKVVSSGTDHVGIILEETPHEIRNLLNTCDLIIAKGMGYFETLTEYMIKKPIVFLFRTKCQYIANYLKIHIQKNVILLKE